MKKLLQSLFVMLLFANFAMAQDRTITGTVIAKEDGLPLPGVSVKVKDTRSGAITDSNGKFAIQLPSGANTVEVSFLGYTSQSKVVSGSVLNFTLVADANDLNEVVVTGYQTIRKSDLTSSASTITSKEIADKPIPSFTQLLQGKAPGLQVTASSGRPGANAYIRMRGTGSITASSDPLIIVDGVAISTTAYNMINPNDIDNITILKDASATAIYGSRGSNGVVVLSTKRGKSGDPTISYSFRYGISNEIKLQNLELMSSEQKLQYEYEGGFTNSYITPVLVAGIAAGTYPAGSTLANITDAQRQAIWSNLSANGTDWQDKFMRANAASKTHEINISGGDDKFTYFFSLNKSDNEGVLQESYWNRTGGRLNVEYQAKPWFKLGTNIGVTHTNENTTRELYNGQALYTSSILLNRYEPLFNTDGTYNYTTLGQNALETAINNPNVSDRISTFGTFYGEAKALKHLTLKTQLGLNYNTLSQEYYLKPGSYLAQTLGYNQKRDNGNRDFLYVWTNTAAWNQTFDQKHTITGLVGTEFTKDKFYSYSLTNQGFPSATVNTLENGSKPTAATTSRSDYALISYFATAQYDYDKRYFLTLSGRRDGSSRFGANKRFANFWAIGGAWDIKNESFFNVDQVSNLKLRGSIGTSGNYAGIGNYTALGTYAYNVNYNALSAASPNAIANPDLTWESNKNSDIGLELGLFDNRINATVDYYHRQTNDLLYPVNLSQTTGFSSFSGNVGGLLNKGIELSLSGDVIRTKDLRWNLFANYTNNSNKVTSLYNDNVIGANTGDYAYLKVGQPVYTYYLVNWAGVNSQTGKNEWFDLDGNRTTEWKASYAKLQEGKSSQIKWYGSFGTTLNYKQLDFSAQFYYSGGNYVYNIVRNAGASEGESINNQQFTEALDYWKAPGDVKRYANLADETQRVTYDSDKYLEKGDYITLRDVTIGYTLQSEIAKKIHVKGLRVFVQGTNLWTGTGFHGIAEQGQSNGEQTGTTSITQPGVVTLFSYPQIRAFTAGVNVKF